MGLDTSHNCWHGAYSSFNRFRFSLADQIGINLKEYIGYGGSEKELETINHDIMPLLNHSDCDGILTPDECRKIANGLEDILKNFKEDLQYDYNFKEKIIQFREGCLEAYSKNEEVDFH